MLGFPDGRSKDPDFNLTDTQVEDLIITVADEDDTDAAAERKRRKVLDAMNRVSRLSKKIEDHERHLGRLTDGSKRFREIQHRLARVRVQVGRVIRDMGLVSGKVKDLARKMKETALKLDDVDRDIRSYHKRLKLTRDPKGRRDLRDKVRGSEEEIARIAREMDTTPEEIRETALAITTVQLAAEFKIGVSAWVGDVTNADHVKHAADHFLADQREFVKGNKFRHKRDA